METLFKYLFMKNIGEFMKIILENQFNSLLLKLNTTSTLKKSFINP